MNLGRLWILWGLILLVVALVPASVQADPSLTSTQYPVTIHGSAAKGVQKITTEAGDLKCATSYHAEAKEASTTLSLAPTFSECDAFGFFGSVIPNGCTYVLHIDEQVTVDKYRANFEIACEAGKSIKLAFATCEVEIAPQSGLSVVELVNDTEASPRKDITFKPEVTGLSYKVLKDGFGCPFVGTGAKTGGTFTASSGTTLTGQSTSNPEAKIGIDVG